MIHLKNEIETLNAMLKVKQKNFNFKGIELLMAMRDSYSFQLRAVELKSKNVYFFV